MRRPLIASGLMMLTLSLAIACSGGNALTIEKSPPELVLQQGQLPSPLYKQVSNEAAENGNGQVVSYETPTGVVITSTVMLFDSEAAAIDYARRQGEQYVAEGYERGPDDRIGDFTLTLSRVNIPNDEPTGVATGAATAEPTAVVTPEQGTADGTISHVIIATRGRAASVIAISGPDVTLGAARILSDLVLTNIDPKYPTPDVS
jgi:hypothetical protein